MKGTCCNIHHFIQVFIESCLILGQICNTRHVDGNYANRACTLSASEETAGFLAQFTQIQAQTTAHTSDIARFHIAVYII